MAGKLSDRELRLRELKLKNAYDQKGLIQRPIAEGDRLLDIVNIYEHEHWPHEKVYCSQCSGHHHRKGFTALVVTASGALIRMLFGSKCGGEAFREDWQTAKRRMEGHHDRQWELARLDRLDTIFTPLKLALADWRTRLPSVVGRKSAFTIKLGELTSRLMEAQLHHNGFLFVHRIMKLRDGTDHLETQLLERLPGAEIFNSVDMIAAVERARAALESMGQGLSTSDGIPTKTLRQRRREFEEAAQSLQAVYGMYEGAQEFFTAETFLKIADWTKRYAVTDKRYVWNGKCLQDKDDWNEFELPKAFADLSSDPLDLIAEYRGAN